MTDPDTSTVACVFLQVASERWGVRLPDMRRILAPPPVTVIPLPGREPWLAGVFHLEAEIVTLIDLARFLKIAPVRGVTRPRDQAVLIVEVGDALFGLLVARLSQVVMIPALDLAPYSGPNQRFALATYAPHGPSLPEARHAEGILAIAKIAQACAQALAEGEVE